MRWLAIAALVLVGAAGCKKTLHWKAIEDELAARIAEHVPPGELIGVTCPETRVATGYTFRCHARYKSGGEDIRITLIDLAGGYRFAPAMAGERDTDAPSDPWAQ